MRRQVKQHLILVGLGVASAICAVVLIEGLLRFVPFDAHPEARITPAGFFAKDPLLGYRPKAASISRSIKKTSRGDPLYDVHYSIDSFGRRVTPRSEPEKAAQFALFFGCSFTFGEGLEDDETLPFYFSSLSPSYAPYNFGFSGYGLQHMFTALGQADFPMAIEERRGILVYTFIDAHMQRLIGSMNVHNRWCKNCPYLSLDSQGRVIRKGTFTSGRPLLSLLYSLLRYSRIARYFHINPNSRISRADLVLAAAVLNESRERFLSFFPDSEFYVVFYPTSKLAKKLRPLLQKQGIRILDLSKAKGFGRPPYVIGPADHHPSALANRALAELILQHIESPR